MDKTQRLRHLRAIDLFHSFSGEELDRFAEEVEELTLAPQELLFREGTPGQEMYLLLSGALKIFKESRTIAIVRAGDYVGEMALLEEKPRSASVIALEPCHLLRITSAQFQNYLARQPQSLVTVMKNLSRRIRRDTELNAREFEETNILIHDMRNQLTAFLLLDRLEAELAGGSGNARGYLAVMQTCRQNLAAMMAEALARAKRQRSPRTVSVASLAALAEETIRGELAVHPDLAGKELLLLCPLPIPPFPFQPLEIRRVLANLLINAGQASPPGGRIEIALSVRANQAEVRISDHGGGIPEELREKIFLPHFTSKETGSGLGLASCKEIIEQHHGGRLTFQANPEGGAIFTFRLPLQPGQESRGQNDEL